MSPEEKQEKLDEINRRAYDIEYEIARLKKDLADLEGCT
jgi:hypothetical protein